jgi:hypothetical protein
LPNDWAPLTHVIERNSLPGVGDGVATTLSPYLFVSDLDWFNEVYPEGSVKHHALRIHEVQHALEQEKYAGDATGIIRSARLASWANRYLNDPEFRWAVEQKGYGAEIRYLMSRGAPIIPEHYASVLSGSTYNGMVSYEDALQWVWDVIRNRR